MRRFVLVVALLGSLLVVPSAHAQITDVFGGDVPCVNFDNGTPGNPADDQRRCGRNGTNEVQAVSVTATGGTYTLTFDGQTTAAIAFDATAPQLDAALEALSNIGAGDVTVSSPSAGNYNVTFANALARTNVAEITADSTGLTGGTASVSTTTPGETPTTTATFDGVPIDVNVAFPAEAAGDGPFPLLIWGHGYGGSKIGFGSMKQYTDRGYAVFSMTARGFHESCGTPGAKARAGSACDTGYVRLMDTRYEVRDAQEFAAELADEDVADPQRVGALGGSYGGGLSMALGALKDRKMLPDDSLVPWVSPVDNEPLRIAGAVPNIPWTDLSYSLVPNGSTLDYVQDGGYTGRFGVMKQSLVNGLYLSGLTGGEGFYAPVGTVPSADLTGWKALLDAGEPYDTNPAAAAALEEIRNHHSSYYVDDSVAPAPMLISSGYTDDLFPADEAIRFYNKTRTLHPGTPISVFFGDFGHQRSANKPDVSSALQARNDAWLDFYVKGTGSVPPARAESWTQTCPNSAGTPSGGPFTAPNWAAMAPGEVRIVDAAAKTIAAGSGDTGIAQTFDPVNSGGNPCRTASAADQAGAATYRALAAAGDGYTLTGTATVIADISSPTANSQLAARLLDVDPSTNQERLVSRAVFRPAVGSARQVFQLHPNGWQFAPGHVAKVELLPKDASDSPLSSYGRPSNGQGDITVSNVEIRIPVLDRPGDAGGAVKVPRDKVVPAGQQLTADAAAIGNDGNASIPAGKLKASAKTIKVPVASPATWDACHATITVLAAGGAGKSAKARSLVLAKGGVVVPGGQTGIAKLKLKRKALKRLKGGKTKVTVQLVTAEQDGTVVAKRVAKLPKKGKKGK
ncbi:MAG: prolyl oligopeptidase family serine peptidase [Solirubrobacterales bacterium]